MAAPPVLPDELIEEILLRLPPDDPACLLRAYAVCQTWSSVVSRASFRRRIHELYRTPPLLGFLHDCDHRIPNFVPTTASAFSLAAPDSRFWQALDCRHGRALFISKGWGAQELLVWEPVTGRQRRLSVPAAFGCCYLNAAVFCASDACDHRDCHGAPFHLLFLFIADTDDDDEYVTSACVHSSERSTWGELASMHRQEYMDFTDHCSVLVGSSLLYFVSDDGIILEHDLARNQLAVIDTPDSESCHEDIFTLMLAEDGGLGLIQDLGSRLQLWSRDDARWVLSRTIYLGSLLPAAALVDASGCLFVLAFAEGANVIFVNTAAGLFTIELPSGQARKVHCRSGFPNVIPLVGFYTPMSPNEHRDLPLSNASAEERGEVEEIAFYQSAITRVPPYGDAAPAFADMDAASALLNEAQEVTDPSR